MPTRPSSIPRWADNGGAIVEPIPTKKDIGWVAGEKPPAQFLNWLENLNYQWFLWRDVARMDFGSGSDGDITIDGTVGAPTGFSKNGVVYTQTRDIMARNLTVTGTAVLKNGGYRTYVSQQYRSTGGGLYNMNGANGQDGVSGGAGGVNNPNNDRLLRFGASGGNGGAIGMNGQDTNGGATPIGFGGAGGNGQAAAGGGNGGGGGGVTPILSSGTVLTGGVADSSYSVPSFGFVFYQGSSNVREFYAPCAGNGGAGGGGGSAASSGGGGGAGGGIITLAARTIRIASQSDLQAKGGQGGAVGIGGDGGFGGGGGGGWIMLAYEELIIDDSSTLSASVNCAGGGPGGGALAGQPGTIIQIYPH